MESGETRGVRRIDHLFDLAEARFDRWRDLLKTSHQWVASIGTKDAATRKSRCEELLGEILPVEDFHAYPGQRLLAALQERVGSSDAIGTARLVQRISTALMNRSYRRDPAEWDLDEEPTGTATGDADHRGDSTAALLRSAVRRDADAGQRWPPHGQQIRKLRRPQDQFVYEPVVVGSFEDAVLGVLLNASVQSVVIYEGFPCASRPRRPLLREVLARALDVARPRTWCSATSASPWRG